MKWIIFIMYLCLSVQTGFSQTVIENPKEIFSQANSYYEEEEYDQAIDSYTRLSKDYESAQLYHNLSLAYFYKDELGKSILYMERARKLAPMNGNIRKNLKLLYENVDSDVQYLPPFFLKAWANTISNLLSPTAWLILHLFLLLSAIVLLYLYLIKAVDFDLHFYYIRGSIITLFILSLLTALLAYNADYLRKNNDYAIIVADSAPLRMGAESNAQESGTVTEGMKVKVVDKINQLYKIRLGDYTEGWVEANVIENI